MSLFAKKKEPRTVLLLDVESGSVASALALLNSGEAPKVFGETRVRLPLGASISTALLIPQIERAAREALVHSAEVAARLRSQEEVSALGNLQGAAVFLSAPWGAPDLSLGQPTFMTPLTDSLAEEVAGYTGLTPSFYTGADAAALATRHLLPREPLLICIVRGETSELLLLGEEGALGYGTIPTGVGTVLRTLRAHGGLSDSEARSALALAGHAGAAAPESLEAAARHFVEQFAGAAERLLMHGGPQGVYVISEEPAAPWFAKALGADESLGAYFPAGSTVRALRPSHLRAHVAAHTSEDTGLMLAALFAHQKYLV